MFGRRWGARAEALREEVRAKLAQHAHDRIQLADAITKLEATLASDQEQRAALRSTTDVAVGNLRDTVADHATDLSKAVAEMARMCALLAERIETEREERRALIEAVGALARQAIEPGGANRPRLLGGNVYASPHSPTASPDDEIVLVDESANGHDRMYRIAVGTAVRCRFGDGWIDGLEVSEIVGDGDEVRYRLRRTTDQYVLPARFDRTDLALVDDAGTPPDPKNRWSKS